LWLITTLRQRRQRSRASLVWPPSVGSVPLNSPRQPTEAFPVHWRKWNPARGPGRLFPALLLQHGCNSGRAATAARLQQRQGRNSRFPASVAVAAGPPAEESNMGALRDSEFVRISRLGPTRTPGMAAGRGTVVKFTVRVTEPPAVSRAPHNRLGRDSSTPQKSIFQPGARLRLPMSHSRTQARTCPI
jgi:hypothetical protein